MQVVVLKGLSLHKCVFIHSKLGARLWLGQSRLHDHVVQLSLSERSRWLALVDAVEQ